MIKQSTLAHSPRAQSRNFWIVLGCFSAAFAAIASGYIRRYVLPIGSVVGIYGCFMLLLAFVLAPGIAASRAAIHRYLALPYGTLALIALWCVPYLIYSAGARDFHGTALVRLLAFSAALVQLYTRAPVKDARRFCWEDALIAAFLIAVVLGHALHGIWNVPLNLDFMTRLFLIGAASWTWIFLRGTPRLGYDARITLAVCKTAAINFAYFAAIAAPLGLTMHFTAWNPRWRGLPQFVADYLEIFLFIAVLEELFFRGFLQNLLSNSLRSWWKGQLIVSGLFGLFHILHAPFPNWRYVVLASIAGWFYGSAYRQTGSLMASALTHALVDTVWRTWFVKS